MDKKARSAWFFLVTLAVCSGCASGQRPANPAPLHGGVGGGVDAANLVPVTADALPIPSPSDFAASSQAFTLGPRDKITIEVYGYEDLRVEEIEVDSSGRITFPIVGTIEVAGKTPANVSSEIAAGLKRKFFRDPQVVVNLKETASQVVSISGEVRRPGIYEMVGDMTLLKVIARAEGWTEFSKKREVLVFRKVGGQRYAALYDVKAIERGVYADPQIFPNDNVVVGDSQARRNLKDIYTVAPPLLAPLIFLFGNNN